MRTRDVLLNSFDNIKILSQYLYMSEDHAIVVHNSVTEIPFLIKMDEQLNIVVSILNSQGKQTTFIEEKANISWLDNIVFQLSKLPPEENMDVYNNRWEEIKGETMQALKGD